MRIDYALLSPALLEHVVSCEVISTLPPKWSDHAAIILELADIPAVPKHPPCALSSKRIKRFQQPKTSVASLFAKKRAAQTAAPNGSNAGAGEGIDSKRQRATGTSASAADVPDTAGPSSRMQGVSEGAALLQRDCGQTGRSSVEDGPGCGTSGGDGQGGERTEGRAEVSGSSSKYGMGTREDVVAVCNSVQEGKGSVAAQGKGSESLTAAKSQKPASLKPNGPQQKSIRAFFSTGEKAS